MLDVVWFTFTNIYIHLQFTSRLNRCEDKVVTSVIIVNLREKLCWVGHRYRLTIVWRSRTQYFGIESTHLTTLLQLLPLYALCSMRKQLRSSWAASSYSDAFEILDSLFGLQSTILLGLCSNWHNDTMNIFREFIWYLAQRYFSTWRTIISTLLSYNSFFDSWSYAFWISKQLSNRFILLIDEQQNELLSNPTTLPNWNDLQILFVSSVEH